MTRKATFTYEQSEVGSLFYFAPQDRAPGPYKEQRHVTAIVDIAADGTFAGVELINDMPPLNTSEGEAADWEVDTEATEKLRGIVDRYSEDFAEPYPTPTVDQPEGVKPRHIGTIAHVDHGKTSLTAAITRILATQPPAPASGERMEVVAWQYEKNGKTFINEHDQPWKVNDGWAVTPLVTLASAQSALAEKDDRIAALQAFKDYTHGRMDRAGVPTHPDGEHSQAGCRIGDRFDILVFRAETAEAQLAQCREALEFYEYNVSGCRIIHSGGDTFRNALTQDGGEKARAALASKESSDET